LAPPELRLQCLLGSTKEMGTFLGRAVSNASPNIGREDS